MRHDAGGHVEIPAQQVDLGQRQVLGADHHRDQKIADRRRHRRHQEEEHHDDAVHGEHLVIGVGGHQVGLRRQQLQADEPRQRSADKEEERNRDQVENRNPLVVAGQQPAQQAVLLGQEVHLRNPGRGLIGKTDDCVRSLLHHPLRRSPALPAELSPSCLRLQAAGRSCRSSAARGSRNRDS